MFAAEFQRFADRPCLRDRERSLDYAATLALGRQLIVGLGGGRALVALRCSLSIEAVAAYVALLAEGHVPLLLETTLADDLARGLVDRFRVDAVVDPLAANPVDRRDGGVELHPDLALLLTTSGSTGSPKLVRLGHRGVRANAEAIAGYLQLGPGERPLLHLPMSYSFGLSIIHSHLIAGASVCLTRSTVMEPGYLEDLTGFEATSLSGVPFHYTALRRLGEARLDVPSLRTLTQAGGRLDPKLVGWFAEWAQRTGRRFVVMYGQTEAGPRIAYLPPEAAAGASDAIGVPIPGAAVRLVDEAGTSVPDGEKGELVVSGPSVMLGYARGPEELALGDECHGSFGTGDLAVRGADGMLRIVGRRSRIIKIYGLRVDVDEVERRLCEFGHRVVCFGADDSLRVLIEGRGDADQLRQTIIGLFSLPPRGIEVRSVDAVERTASGKIAADALTAAWDRAAA